MISSISSAEKSHNCLSVVNDALNILRSKPKNGKKYYDVLYAAYIEPGEPTVDDILKKLNISRALYFKTRTQALQQLSYLLWKYQMVL